MENSFKKYKDDWCVKIYGTRPQSGSEHTITKKNGETQTVKIYEVLFKDKFSDDEAYICSIIHQPKSKPTKKQYCDNCDEPARKLYKATDKSGLTGYVCSRCYNNEQDWFSFG